MTKVEIAFLPFELGSMIDGKVFTYKQLSMICHYFDRYQRYSGFICGTEKEDFLLATLCAGEALYLEKMHRDGSVSMTEVDGKNFEKLIPLIARGISEPQLRVPHKSDLEVEADDFPYTVTCLDFPSSKTVITTDEFFYRPV